MRSLSFALAALLSPAIAHAQATYPAHLDRQSVLQWVALATDIKPEQVVGMNASSLFAIVSQNAAGVTLRAEALTPEAAARSGVLSLEMQLQIDCAEGRIRTGQRNGYATRAPDAHPIVLAPADPAWRKPKLGTPLEGVWRVVCQAGGAGPAPGAGAWDEAGQPTAAPPQAPSWNLPPEAAARAPKPRNKADPAPLGRFAVQLVSSPSEAGSRAELARLRSRFARDIGPLDTRVVSARVRDRTVYRGLVVGFASRSQAAAFCKTMRRSGQACLPR